MSRQLAVAGEPAGHEQHRRRAHGVLLPVVSGGGKRRAGHPSGTGGAPLQPADLYAARERIAPLVVRTPLIPSTGLSRLCGARVHCKLETVQRSGSFKARGAANALLCAPPERLAAGVITYSTGNHGRAVANVARAAGARATVCVSRMVPETKLAALRGEEAEIAIVGESQDEAAHTAQRLACERGLLLVDPINDAAVIAGHGTIGLELLEDLPALDAVLVPVSGGALLSGIALALKSARPRCRVLGVCMEKGAAMHASQRAGHPVLVEEAQSLADSLQGGILLDNRYTFAMVRELVDDIVLVSEEEIGRAMAYALERERLVLEGAAAVGVAALLRGGIAGRGETVAWVATGAAVDVRRLTDIARGHRAWLDSLGLNS